MRTIEVTRLGGPEVLQLRERPDPVADTGQVVVEVVPLLWLDTALRSGWAAIGSRSSRPSCPAPAWPGR